VIVQRLHLNVARGFGNVSKAKELCVAEFSRLGVSGRVLTPEAAPYNTIVIEYEWESLSEQERFWTDHHQSEERAKFFTEFNKLIEPGGTHETWNVAASF
jgi:hypothetical protein